MESLRLPIDGEEKYFEKRDVRLFTFLGQSAVHGDLSNFDHIYLLCRNEEGEATEGLYMFQFETVYPEIKEFIKEHNYPQHINLTAIDPADVKAFEDYCYGELRHNDSFPEGWLKIAD